MTPKNKAKELYNKYATHVVMWVGDINTTHQNCKQCAIIAVDEILDSIDWDYYEGSKQTEHMYWKEVKQEIQEL
jgi:hypothetical protein